MHGWLGPYARLTGPGTRQVGARLAWGSDFARAIHGSRERYWLKPLDLLEKKSSLWLDLLLG